MKSAFADTSYYIALATAKDNAYSAAKAFSDRFRGKLLTTEYVLLELGNFFSKFALRSMFVALYDSLVRDEKTTIVPCDGETLRRAIELYRARQDKEWSLTDCTSFVVMRDAGLHESLTTDHHFEQAGFKALLPRS